MIRPGKFGAIAGIPEDERRPGNSSIGENLGTSKAKILDFGFIRLPDREERPGVSGKPSHSLWKDVDGAQIMKTLDTTITSYSSNRQHPNLIIDVAFDIRVVHSMMFTSLASVAVALLN